MNRVSVIIPVWNMANFLPDAVASIARTHEVIIVVADSDDRSLEVARDLADRRPEVIVLNNPRKLPAAARNLGLQRATGEILAFLDADDIWPEGRLDIQLERLNREPKVDVVGGLVVYFDRLNHEALAPADDSRLEIKFVHVVQAMVFRRIVFQRVGLFEESLTYGEDADLFLRIIEAEIPIAILNVPTLYYRRHGNSMMNRDLARQKSDLARVAALSLQRKRKLGLPLTPLSFDRYFEEL